METIDKQILLYLRNEGKTGKYVAARIDETTADKYYGFLSNKGEWYLMKITAAGLVLYYNEDLKNFDLATLLVNFNTTWTNRATTTFVEFPYCQLT